jgi:porin
MLREPWLVLLSILLLASVLVLTAGCLLPAQASDGPAPAAPYLLGGWGGQRQALEDDGLTFEGAVITEFVVTLRGGRHQGSVVLGNIDLTMALDTEQADWWPGGTFFVDLLGDVGGNPVSFVGASQVTSNIEAIDAFRVFEAWYEHRFGQNTFSLLVGLYDYNAEFYVLDNAQVFLNSSFGIGPEVAQVGPSIFPVTALAGRIKYQPVPHIYVTAILHDGVPGDPGNPRRTNIILRQSDGLFYGLELGLTPPGDRADSRHYKVAVGAWYHDTDFEDFNTQRRSHNGGIYALGEITVWREHDLSQGLGIFGQVGHASSERNQIALYLGAGLTYTGVFPRRDSDVLGFAVAQARNSEAFLSTQPDRHRAETVLEFTYRARILSALSLQPDVQYVIHPGTNPLLENALVFTLRVEATL